MDARVKPTTVRHSLCLMECTTLILLVSRSLRINWTRERSNAVPHQNIVFHGLLSALMAQLQRGYRRKIGDCVRLIDSTSVQLSSLSGDWATFSAGVCGAKAHIIYDPDADQPLYLMVTAANINDTRLHQAGCR